MMGFLIERGHNALISNVFGIELKRQEQPMWDGSPSQDFPKLSGLFHFLEAYISTTILKKGEL